jgi:hypothetical protein
MVIIRITRSTPEGRRNLPKLGQGWFGKIKTELLDKKWIGEKSFPLQIMSGILYE